MEAFMPLPRALTITLYLLVTICMFPVDSQVTTPCTSSMISSFAPCLNYITASSPNGTSPSPTSDCCTSLKSLMGSGMDCLCLIVTGSVPFPVPINRTLAISLPRTCKMTGVPVKCQASAAPLPAPGPIALVPSLSPTSLPNTPPSVSSPTPEATTTPDLTPPADVGVPPATTTGSRPVLTPSSAASTPSNLGSAVLVLLALGSVVLNI